MDKKIKLIKIIIFSVLMICMIIFIRLHNLTNLNQLKEILIENKLNAPIIYILLFSILPTFFVTVTILAIAAGAMFGFINASIYTFIGAFINSSLTYLISKYVAYDYINDLALTKYPDLYFKLKNKMQGSEGFILMLTMRLLPMFPFTLLNYVSGVVGFEYKIFITSSLIGIIPGMLCYVNIGANAINGFSKELVIAISIFLAFSLTTSLIAKKLYKKTDSDNTKNI